MGDHDVRVDLALRPAVKLAGIVLDLDRVGGLGDVAGLVGAEVIAPGVLVQVTVTAPRRHPWQAAGRYDDSFRAATRRQRAEWRPRTSVPAAEHDRFDMVLRAAGAGQSDLVGLSDDSVADLVERHRPPRHRGAADTPLTRTNP